MTDDDGYVSPRRSPRLSPAAPLDAAAAGRSSPAAPVAQSVLSLVRARRAAGAPVTPQEDSFIPTSTETVTCTRIRFGRDESGPHRHHPSENVVNRVKHPSFSVKSDGNETRVEMQVFGPITGCPIVRPARAEEITLIRTQCDGDAPFIALQVMADVYWVQHLLNNNVYVPDRDNEEGRKYIVCECSSTISAVVDLLCRDARIASLHRKIPESERASYFRSASSVRREEMSRLEDLQRDVDRKLRRLETETKAVLSYRNVLERREATVRREEFYVRDERRQQARKHAPQAPAPAWFHRQRVDQHTTSTQTDATQTQPTLLLAQQWIQQHRHDTGTQTDATQTQTQPIQLEQLEQPIQLPPQLLPMLPPLPMPPSFRTFQPPQPPSLPALTRREIETLGRAKLRQYLGLLGESQQGNPEDLRARITRYFDALGIDTYYPPG